MTALAARDGCKNMGFQRCDQTSAWSALVDSFTATGQAFDLRTAFFANPGRFTEFSQEAPHLFADLSKNLVDGPVQSLLFDLARQCGLEMQRDAMFAGECVNNTEQRAAMHFLLRDPFGFEREVVGNAVDERKDIQKIVSVTTARMLRYAESVRTDEKINDVVCVGIGGSNLGPQTVVLALEEFSSRSKTLHFVSNVDGYELASVLRKIKPESTLFLIASKTFTTAETMSNAHAAKRWFEAQGGLDISRHFAALTTNEAAAAEFGITTTFGFWDWVGGR